MGASRSERREKPLHVRGCKARRRRAAFGKNRGGKLGFAVLQFDDFLFDRPGSDELVDEDVPRLADAMGAIGRLTFHGGIPPGVVVDDGA